MNWRVNVCIFVIVVHEKNGGCEQHVLFEVDAIPGRNYRPSSNLATSAENDRRFGTVTIYWNVQPNTGRDVNIIFENYSRCFRSCYLATMMNRNSTPKREERIGQPQPSCFGFGQHSIRPKKGIFCQISGLRRHGPT